MSQSVTPTQLRVNDPYQQRLLQFDTTDSRVYLSRVSNYILKSIGNDVVIKGLDVSFSLEDTTITLTISPGLIIQDSTLIEITTETSISFDLNGYDSCNGYLILYTNYQYLNIIDSNKFLFKLSYITKDGLDIDDIWDKNRNRVYLNLYRFDNTYNLTEIINPDFFYISGKIFFRRGKSNFLPSETIVIAPYYYHLLHSFNTPDIFVQLFDETYTEKYINTLTLFDDNIIDISIDEYKPFDDNYYLSLADPNDVESFTVLKSNLDINYQYTLFHNYDQKYVMVQVYNDSKELIHPRFIKFVDNDSLTLDFSNYKEDLAATYQILLIKNISIQTIQSNDFISDNIQVDHNLNKFNILSQIVSNTTDKLHNTSVIVLNNNNSILIDTTVCDILPSYYTIMFYNNTKLLFHLFNNNTYVIPYHVYTSQINNDETVLLTHNLNNMYPIIQLYDTNRNIVQPNEICVIDENNISLEFIPVPVSEILTVVLFSYFSDNIYTLSESSVGIYTLDLTNTRQDNPLFQIYNSENYIIQPDIISKVDDVYTFNFGISVGVITVVAAVGFINYTGIFSSSQATVTHNLNTLYPLVQIYKDNEIFYPNNIQVLNSNEISLDLAAENFEYQINIISGIIKQPVIYTSLNSYIQEFSNELKINNKVLINHNLSSNYLSINIFV